VTNDIETGAINQPKCWSCGGAIAAGDVYCRHCGAKLSRDENLTGNGADKRPTKHIHARLESIEKLLLKTVLGVVALLILVGWIVLQLHHFGR